jgi:predicted aminopeptidase
VKKKIVLAIVLLLVAALIYFRDLVSYGWMQGKGQFEILWAAQPIEKFLESPDFPDSLKAKLRLIQEIRSFAVDSLGISPSDNYTTMYNQKGENLLWNVTATEPFALVPYRWKFPFLGSFPYKGYFDLEKAKLERERLDSAGYDTHIGMVSGWSTLGWFKDPILSKMLERSEGDLAELIIHELTHGTLYVKDSVEFNENLASFVGRMGAIQFLKNRFGQNSAELTSYVNSEVDYEKIYRHYLNGARKLDSLYTTMDESMSVALKSEQKRDMIYDIMKNLDTLRFKERNPFQWKAENRLPNNTFFMSYLRYRGKMTSFENELEERFGGDLRAYVTYLKGVYPSL